MQTENLTFEQKREYVENFRGLIYLTDIATEKKISLPQISLIISGKREDYYGVIDTCYSLLQEKLKPILKK